MGADCIDNFMLTGYILLLFQSSKLGGSPKPVAYKMSSSTTQVRRACEKKSYSFKS